MHHRPGHPSRPTCPSRPACPRPLLAASALLTAALLAACSAPGGVPGAPGAATGNLINSSAQPAQASHLSSAAAAAACTTALPGQALPGVRLTEATLVASGSQRARQPNGTEVGSPLPEHCLLRGRIDERTGADGLPYHTGFELRLPSAFSGRFFYQRGGGNDGVIATAPAMRVSQGATIAAAWTVQQFLAVAPTDADGQRVLAQALSETQLQRLAREVLARCDAAGGLVDGLVNDPASCRMSAAPLQCPAGSAPAGATGPDAGCLSAPQAQALDRVMAGPRNRARTPLYFGWPWDPGIADAGWRAWTLSTATQGPSSARHITLMAGALGHEFVTPSDPGLSTLNFDFERDPARMAAFHAEYNTADDVQLTGFRQRGGKLMLVHGTADPIFSASESVDYLQRLTATHGEAATAAFAREFLVPGMGHCAGGPATDGYDGLTALVRWVEQGEAPDRLIARGTGTLPTSLTRPLCPWPKLARYGGGDVNRAESFACR